ncbi:MAG: hypothetical protein KA716_32160 [Gloeotrichia echinulata DEX184]
MRYSRGLGTGDTTTGSVHRWGLGTGDWVTSLIVSRFYHQLMS